MDFLEGLAARAARPRPRRIVLAEGDDPRAREAARRLAEKGSIVPILISASPEIEGWEGELRSPATDPDLDRLAESYRERLGTQVNIEVAREAVLDPLFFAGMLVSVGAADGAVAGAVSATSDVVRAALRCVGAAGDPGLVTGAFYMVVSPFRGTDEPEVLTFADSGVIPDPGEDQLIQIARQAAEMRPLIVGDEPRVAFLSYSTKGSADGPSVRKMRDALAGFRKALPSVPADGELQVDAALIDSVGSRKAPNSSVAGKANVLIFPDLDSGNIAYKLVERLAGAAALGPILHGLSKPFNDLSRGAGPRDIEWVSYVTALMARDLDS